MSLLFIFAQLVANLNSVAGSTYYNSYWSVPPYRHYKVLAVDGRERAKVLLEWRIDYKTKTITFDLTCRTTGYVGFGLQQQQLHQGKDDRADIVIGGIYPNGTSYFTVWYHYLYDLFNFIFFDQPTTTTACGATAPHYYSTKIKDKLTNYFFCFIATHKPFKANKLFLSLLASVVNKLFM